MRLQAGNDVLFLHFMGGDSVEAQTGDNGREQAELEPEFFFHVCMIKSSHF